MVNRVLSSTLQSRLGMVQDNLRRKLLDNQLGLIGDLNDVLRIKYRKTYEGDNVSWIIDKADIVKCSFPPLVDIPYRKIKIDKTSQTWQLTSLVSAFDDDMQEKAYTAQIPCQFDIDVGDVIFRIFLDENQAFPIIIALEAQELLGTFGHHKIIMNKFKCTIPTDDIPQEVVNCIHDMAIRRLKINY